MTYYRFRDLVVASNAFRLVTYAVILTTNVVTFQTGGVSTIEPYHNLDRHILM